MANFRLSRLNFRALIEFQQDESLAELESLLGFFASFVLDADVVQQIMSWDMTILRESPWYQEIVQVGIEQGERSLLTRLLARKFGALSPDALAKVQALSLPQLEDLSDRLLDFDRIEDLLSWLEQH